MRAVVHKIESILNSAYETKNYVDLVNEIFDSVKFIAPDKFRKEFSNFSTHIEGSIHIGNYTTPNNKNIIILAVQLKNERFVQNSRSTQRSYSKKLIENGNADAAFIAFYTLGDPKWRLSFVRLDYQMKIENGRLQTAESLTPAKRYSYLVGQDEPCHTAISRFDKFITDSQTNPEHPTLDDLEEAFSVEKVTNEFFELYCEKFHQLREYLEVNEDFRIEAAQHNFTSAQFAKKLMGQIVFLYFLQKKGWLGVKAWPDVLTEKEYKNAFFAKGSKSRELIPRIYSSSPDGTYKISSIGLKSISDADEAILAVCVKGKPWGSGPHNFMRKLFEISEKRNVNFYNDLLEPLFYDALNVNRGEQGYCPALHCRIPFLSGGLFEPIDGYDWEHNDFAIPNSVFSSSSDKGRDADGILDIFDRYNFTMSEDEPMEREVAIDPEMLGKVFENLLEVQDRKSKGAFYTPREIVHYMCQESLINYLSSTMNIEEEAVRDFVIYGDFMKDEDTVKQKRQGNGSMYISEALFKINPDGEVIVNRLLDMDKALATVRFADPAVGSGAFPLGMLNEIVRARQNISAYLEIPMNAYERRMMHKFERSPHTLKYETIRNCIFAVDIDPSAVDIAQLRLWLSLVIDDEINPDAQTPLEGHRNPLPLPNLESNILCGNSLIDEFQGTALINQSDLISNTVEGAQLDIHQGRFESVLKMLIETQEELFRCDNTGRKKQLKEQIESFRDMILMTQLEGCDPDKIQKYYDSKHMASKPYVLWQLDFARVFREKGGFDIVIGNPPYVGEKGNKELFRPIAATDFGKKFYYGKMDLFYFFFHKALDIGSENAEIAFITTNYYPTAFGGKILRKDFMERTNIRRMINFNGLKIFESAMGQHNMITMLTKRKGHILANNCLCKVSGLADAKLLKEILYSGKMGDAFFDHRLVEQANLYDGDEAYIRMMGIGGSATESVDSILDKISKSGKTLKEIANIKQGIVSGADKYTAAHEEKYGLGFQKGMGIFVLKPEELEALSIPTCEMQYVKPVYKNSEISRYFVNYRNELFVFYMTKEVHENDAPTIISYLNQFKPILSAKREAVEGKMPWYSLNWARDRSVFEAPEKIVNSRRAKRNTFALETKSYYEQSDMMITVIKQPLAKKYPPKYVLALLNSKLYYVWFLNRGKMKGDMLELYGKPLEEIPIKLPDDETATQIVTHVNNILNHIGEGDNEITMIDRLIYNLYGLTENEISLIEEYDC